ncbi:MAG: PEP/pyruvate-binding domain-containing protein, partial [Desulfobacterales bacterium]
FVEDSPNYLSSLLPILYRELVIQTQSVMEEGLNEEHRLLAMRARPKILVAESYEEAWGLFIKYEPYVLGVISDVRFPRGGRLDKTAGLQLLAQIKTERFDIPLLLVSAESENAAKAAAIPAMFVDKNSETFHSEVRSFFLNQLGFGEFVFRRPDGGELMRAANLRGIEHGLARIPDDTFKYHCRRNDISRWLFARAEIELACKVRPLRDDDFTSVESHRRHLVEMIHSRRMGRQKGLVVNFDPRAFDQDTDFLKIGKGSIGGKARGLAFMANLLLQRADRLKSQFKGVEIFIPQTMVLTTEIFESYVETNNLKGLAGDEQDDEAVAQRFAAGQVSPEIREQLEAYLVRIDYPLAIRSSSLLEDAQFRAYAGLYKTYMLPNDHPDLACRLEQLLNAIKMVFASTYFSDPKAFSKRVGQRTEEEKMAVIIQKLTGSRHNGHFYPAISGVAQSHNYYPFDRMKPEEGIATIALGLGKVVMEGEKTLRFSPHHPQLLPQRTSVDDILNNAQRFFYGLKMDQALCVLSVDEAVTLAKREIFDAREEFPVRALTSSYDAQEHRIRDSGFGNGYPVLTFAQVLKYNQFPLADILKEVLTIGQEGMGCPVEVEFSANLMPDRTIAPRFAVLQVRPMSAREAMTQVKISPRELAEALILSQRALGNTVNREMADIVYVDPETFDPAQMPQIAREISEINGVLMKAGRKYLLMGPGRWGSADRWLGIPVAWKEICGVGAMVETAHAKLQADPSQGSHFFHNLTSLGINYLTVGNAGPDRVDWQKLAALPREGRTPHLVHIRLAQPLTLKVDGRSSQGVVRV